MNDLGDRLHDARYFLIGHGSSKDAEAILEAIGELQTIAEKGREIQRLTANVEANYREIQDCLMATGDEGESKSVADAVKALRADHDRLEAANERLRQACRAAMMYLQGRPNTGGLRSVTEQLEEALKEQP